MNREQELLIILQEECGEVVQAVAKIHRFGKSEDNLERLEDEFADMLALMKLLLEEGYLDGIAVEEKAERKIKKLETYMKNKKW
jgi:NTP pyrophosphatase (non-canonical NTP hydrolase)